MVFLAKLNRPKGLMKEDKFWILKSSDSARNQNLMRFVDAGVTFLF